MNTNDIVSHNIKTYEHIAEDYAEKWSNIDIVKHHADFFIKNLDGEKVLDIGCGPGRDTKYFTENQLEVIGIDLTSKFIEIASRNIPNTKFLQMDMRYLEFPENSFDGIWSCASFLHIPKSEAKTTLLGFHKILKSNGLIYLDIKEGEGEKFVEKDIYKGKTKFFAFYTKEEFSELLESCGFKIIKTSKDYTESTWINVFAKKI